MPDDMPEAMVKLNEAFAQIGWLMPLVAVAELVGGILFIIPRFRALGAIIIFPIMIGILLTHIFVEPSGIPIATILFLINIWVIVENREKYFPLIQK